MLAGRWTMVLEVVILAFLLTGCGDNEPTKVVANEAEASLCQAAFSASAGEGKPQAPLVMYKQSDWAGDAWVLYTHPLVPAAAQGEEPQTMVCIRETREDITEDYIAGDDHVYELNWDIRVVLLPGGSLIAAGRGEGDPVGDKETYPNPHIKGGAHVYGDPPSIELLRLIAPALDRIIFTGQSIEAIAFSPDGRTLVSAGLSADLSHPVPVLQMWDVETGEFRSTFNDMDGVIQGLAFAPDGKSLAISRINELIGIWDANTGELLQKVHWCAGKFLTYSPDGAWLVGSDYHSVQFCDLNQGEGQYSMEIGWREPATFSPDGKNLAVGVEGAIKLFDPNSHVETASITTESPHTPAFSPDGKWMASSDPLVLWDTGNLQAVRTLGEGNNFIFSPDSRLIAQLSSENEAVHIWEVATGEKLDTLTITTHVGWVDMGEYQKNFQTDYPWLAFSPDGKWLATWGGEEGTIRLWDMSKYAPANASTYPR